MAAPASQPPASKLAARTEHPLAWLRRAINPVVPALIVALPPLYWVVDATHRASLTSLGRDQGIFQYVAWAVLRGAKDYRDVRDVNGPLTHLIHMVFLGLGGADEHRFRILDLAITGLTFAFVGACLPGIARPLGSLRMQVFPRAAWALAAWTILGGQYVLYLFWDLAQRESFFDWFLFTSVALQLACQAGLRDVASTRSATWSRWLLGLAGALSVVTWFGKPTYVFFTVAQLLALFLDDELKITRKARAKIFAWGAAAGASTQLLFLLVYADIGAFARIYLVDVPTMYRFIWPRTVVEMLSMPGTSTNVALALVSSLVLLGLVWNRQMPRRAIAIALLPLCGLGSVVVQGKGFPYHFHPMTAGMHLQWLLLVVWLWEKSPRASRSLTPMLAAAALALRVALVMPLSPHIQALWILTKARDPEERASRDYLVYFQTHDFFPWELRQTAEYLRAHTKADDRVQIYGMDPYVLFLAERMSATPFIYAYDLNADAALEGGQLPEPVGLHPTMQEAARIRALRDAHEKDLSARLQKEPPAAFVFFDKSPTISWQNAWQDFGEHNAETAVWVRQHYRETAVFGADHVWMRQDLAESIAGGPEQATP